MQIKVINRDNPINLLFYQLLTNLPEANIVSYLIGVSYPESATD